MIQLSTILYLAILTFGLIGYLRGFDKELVSMAGIVLALFILIQFNGFFTSLTSGAGNPLRTLFYLQSVILLVVTFYAYQTPPERLANLSFGGRRRGTRDIIQTRLLGVLAGGFNGYLVFGSLWWFLASKNYPLASILPPQPETASASLVSSLPLEWLLDGNLLTLFVIGLFLFVLIAII
jgi:uncharacterized membrane protein required for colicin V production